ncbi:MAG: Smr/MutS family protein [Rickettsiales bacterium]|jgi:DNA-nicking Smr family endonuclease|nr:Smr/MutS family protein [Rickettsiales bacterium]
MSPPRKLTPEEKKLWKLVTKQTQPLHAQNEEAQEEEKSATKPKMATKKIMAHKVRPRVDMPAPVKEALKTGNINALDKNNGERFRKGEMAIEAMLDLHGLTYSKAEAALKRFIEHSYRCQKRSLLVITGKGSRGEGVLRQALPVWLNHEDLRPMILAISLAKAKHGGSGAYYVLLKRKR